jgi:uncharacterized protein GlcG (DUF336 family)
MPASQGVKVLLRAVVAVLIVSLPALHGGRVASQGTSADPTLSADDVLAALQASAGAINSNSLSVAVVDRGGRILGVLGRPGAAQAGPDVAVTTARAAAMFSNKDAPLSTRTVRFISGIHLPPGVPNAPNAALYGIENSNRGCQLNANSLLQPTRSLAGSGLEGPVPFLPACGPSDTRGCSIGSPITIGQSAAAFAGFSTGKADVLDGGEPLDVPVNPGGFAIYRNGRVAGAVGVSGLDPDQAEYVAFVGAATVSSGGLPLPVETLPVPGAVFIDGLRLPFFGSCISVDCVKASIEAGVPRAGRGAFSAADIRVQPRPGQVVPTGYLIGPLGSPNAGGLTEADVRRIVDQAVARALVTRAQIRLPLTQPTSMIIAVSDQSGTLLAAFRMNDSTVFSFDVATAKARNAYYFSTREGYEVLRDYVRTSRDAYTWEPEPPAGQGWAITNRTLGFGGQPLFPPGIDLETPVKRGPWFDLFLYDLANPCTEGPGASRGANRNYPNQSGIVWFPGSAPLYKSGRLVGGVGVSGDGVEQDDYVTAGAVNGFDAPAELRVDNSTIRTVDGVVRLPYWKFPRNPELR